MLGVLVLMLVFVDWEWSLSRKKEGGERGTFRNNLYQARQFCAWVVIP